MNWLAATAELTLRNTRRYGGYVVHMGIVFMFIGFTGAAFNKDTTQEVVVGDSIRLGHYELKVTELKEGENPNYSWHRAAIDVYKDGQKIDTLHPERRFYPASRQGTSEVAIRRRLNQDLYLNFAGMSEDNQRAVIQAYIFPLVSWIWVGAVVLFGGTLLCLVPSKVRLQYPRTEVVGVVEKHAPVRQ
jgi:cytochrome c-type biogenesis protein CcmF